MRVCCLLMLCDGVRMYNQPCSETLHGLAPVRLLHEDLDALDDDDVCAARWLAGQTRVWRPHAREAARPPSKIHTHISPAGNVRPSKVLLLLRP